MSEQILERARTVTAPSHVGGRVYRGDAILEIESDAVADVATKLRDDPELRMDSLIDCTAVHWPAEQGREFELVYQYRSVRNNLFLRVKTRIADGAPIQTLTGVFQSANFLEREVFDLFGIQFTGHPDLRRILLPDGFEGSPLRKDYPVEGPNFPEDARRNDVFGRLDPDDFWADVDQKEAP